MPLTSGMRLGPYEIIAALGAGGMGEVYRARDTRLDRDVAIKVLPAVLAADPAARARFEREAKAIAALSHPNILAIHEFGSHDSFGFTVTELLEGSTLRERLHDGPLLARKAVDIAVQIAHGLAAAHERGIVHRDLKPENLFITSDGRAKILDFGLARVTSAEAAASGATLPTTIHTDPALVMGTAGYMSPEQVRGQTVDSRSDLFAFGAVLYEMLSGRRAFKRDTSAETMTAILKEEPLDLTNVIGDLPPALDRIVRRCLEKNPSERFQSARDLAFTLENVTSGTAPSRGVAEDGGQAVPARRNVRLRWIAIAILALGFGAEAGWLARARQSAPATSAAITFAQLTDFPGIERAPSVSADGKTVVYSGDASGNFDIYSLRVGGRNPVNLTTDSPDVDTTPVLSPAGDQIAFRSERAGGGIFVMGATGESVRRVTDFGYDPGWSPDGKQLVVSSISIVSPFERTGTGELSIVTIANGARRPLKTPRDAVQPNWSPNARYIAFWSVEKATSRRDIWTIRADGSGEAVPVTRDSAIDWSPVWSPNGRDLYFASDRAGVMNLWRIAIDENTGGPAGPATPLSVPASFLSGFSFAADGRIVYVAVDRRSTLQRLDFDPDREAVTGTSVLLQSPRTFRSLDWSPDGQSVVFANFGSADNLYLIRADGSGYRQLTDDGFRHRGPHFFPDGSRLLFYSNRGGGYQAWSIRPDGSDPRQLTNTPAGVILPIISPAADRIAYTPSLSSRWVLADLGPSSGAERVIDMPPAPGGANVTPSSWSRDGSRIAVFELLPGVAEPRMFVYDLTTKHYTPLPVTGASPAWLPDGRRLLYTTRNGVGVIDTATGQARDVFKLAAALATPMFGFGLSPDGRRIALLVLEEQSDLWMLSSK